MVAEFQEERRGKQFIVADFFYNKLSSMVAEFQEERKGKMYCC